MTIDRTDPANGVTDRSTLVESVGAEVCPAGLPVITAQMLVHTDTLRGIREAGVMHHVNMGGRETGWLLAGYEAAAKALVDPRLMGEPPQAWSTRDEQTANEDLLDEEDLFFLPKDQHAKLRRMITRQLTHRRILALTDRIQGEIDRLLDAMPLAEPVDFIASFARPLPVAVLCELLGIPAADRHYIRDYVYGWIAESGAATPVTKSTGLAMAEYLKTLIADRRANPRNDLISAMAQAEGPSTSDLDVLSAVRLLLVAGNRPVTRLMISGLSTLLRPRSRWQQLVDEPTLIDAVVEELLRFVTPTSLSSRYAKEEADVEGVRLSKGSGVHCALGAANRDPDRFSDPDDFNPRRLVNPHLAFGLGRKHCLGAALARAEARLAFSTLTRRFPQLVLDQQPRQQSPGGRQLLVVLAPSAATT